MAVDPSTLAAHVQPGQTDKPADDVDKPVAPDETSGAQTPEEIEAYWRNRVSKKDQAHAAAERALREELTTLRGQQATATASSAASGQSGSASEAEAALRRQIEETNKALETEKAARVIDQRKAKYPLLAQQGLEDAVFASASDASLARLNALADDEPRGTMIAPTGPKRGAPTPPKPYHEQTKDELLQSLRGALEREGQGSA